MKRYPVYRSAAARVSQRLGAVAVPVSILAVLANRADLIDAPEMIYSVLAGALLGLAAIAVALAALVRLWVHGGIGAPRAVLGTLYGLLAIVPLGLFAGRAVLAPGMPDVSTDWQDPPQLNAVAPTSDEAAPGMLTVLFAPSGADRQRDLFPDIVPRRYRIAPGQLHAAAVEVARRSGWNVSYELPPDLLDAPTGLQVVARTQLVGLPEDMVLRIRPDRVGALLDVRSASRLPIQGLTGNAERIRFLFESIDEVLLETYGDIERIAVTDVDLADQDNPDASNDTTGAGAGLAASGEAERIPVPPFKPYFESEDAGPPAEAPGDDLPPLPAVSG